MKKGLFKVLAVSLAVASITGFTAMDVFADNTIAESWTVTDASVTKNITKTITVENISKDDDPTITAYQIVKGTYKDNKLTDFVPCEGLGSLTIGDIQKPTAKEITDIASAIRENTTSLTGIKLTKGSAAEGESTVSYTADVEPGLYIVIVTDSKTGIVYNPAIIAVNISDANDIEGANGGTVDMTQYFLEGTESVYLKSNNVSINKSIVAEDGKDYNGYSAGYGETVNFKIDEMTIPSYSADYKSVKYVVTDTLEATSFSGINNFSVKVDDTVVMPADDTFTLTLKDKNGNAVTPTETESLLSAESASSFTVDFTEAFIRSHGGSSVVITYSTVVSETAGYNYSENQNTAKLEYTNNPDVDTTGTVQDTTYSYTFGISANIDGEDETNKETTNELNKVSEADGEYTTVTDDDGNTVTKNKYALKGAEFTLYNNIDYAEEHVVGTTLSDEYGLISFVGLNEGTYFLKETNAPNGYTINPTVYRIEINAVYGGDGVLTSYSITTYKANEDGTANGDPVGCAEYTNTAYTVNDDGSVDNNITAEDDNTPLAIVDTKLASLPSTGGAGTIALTVGASIGMALFLTIHIVNKKKNSIAD